MSKPDPAKAVYVPMGKRKLPKPKAVNPQAPQWTPHNSQYAKLDPLADMLRESGWNG